MTMNRAGILAAIFRLEDGKITESCYMADEPAFLLTIGNQEALDFLLGE